MVPDDQQWICSTTPECLCVAAEDSPGNPDDGERMRNECVCASEPNIARACGNCNAPMVLINVNTGEPVAAKAVANG